MPERPHEPRLRRIPPVNALLDLRQGRSLRDAHGHGRVVEALRAEIAAWRQGGGDVFDAGAALDRVAARLAEADRPRLRRVVNATGVIVHTNLGRAPLHPAAVEAVAAVAAGYSTLEYDLETGGRGSRHRLLEEPLRALTGAEAAAVVNNNAAAVLLAVSALAAGGEAVMSRGELVEIGGAFRIPDVIAQGGARLREVGTTNRTRVSDYAAALGPETRLILKVHQSNYRIVGFTEMPAAADLVALARAHDLPVVEDLGSGSLLPAGDEPTVAEAVAAGVDLVTFSGDKLLGGPQAGLIVGRADLVERCRRHPLMRAVRPDKMTLAALEATLRLYRAGQGAGVPVPAMLAADPDALRDRARRLAALIGSRATVEVVAVAGRAGGGALPERALPSVALRVSVAGFGAEALARHLRRADPPVIARVHDGAVLLDLRTVADDDFATVVAALP